jgi:mono/diheme cytochrome c family protein
MKNLIRFTLACALIFISFIFNPLKAQSTQKPIPADVMAVVKKTCVTCHMEPGNKMALSHLNFSKWDEYKPEKQASKAKAICKQVSKETMHPKKFLKEHPEAIPTKEEVKSICDWAAKMQNP